MGSRWNRVRNETILSSRGREGRCERVGVVFSPLRRLTSLRRGEGGSEPGADVGRTRWWGPWLERERERERESVESIKSMVSQADTGSYRWGLTRRRMFGPVRSIGRPYRSPVVFISALFTPTCFFPPLVPRRPLPHLSFPSTRLDLLGVWRGENIRVTSRRINVRMEYAILLSRVQRVIYSDRRFRTSIDDPGRIHFGAIGDAIGRKESKALEKRRKRTGVPRKSRERNKR